MQHDGKSSSSLGALIQWSYFLASIVLLATSLYAGCFNFTNNEQKHRCHPKCHFLFMALTIPGFISVLNLAEGPSDDVLMVRVFFSPLILNSFFFSFLFFSPACHERPTHCCCCRIFIVVLYHPSQNRQFCDSCSMYCVISSGHSHCHPPNYNRITVGILLRRFVHLDLGLQIFLLFSLVVSSFSLFPYAWRAFVPSGFWEVSFSII